MVPRLIRAIIIGHAVVMVGYDESQRVWIMRNSWGPDWGDGGSNP